MNTKEARNKKSELELLRAVLGRGPANLLICLIFSAWSVGANKRDWKIGPITADMICMPFDDPVCLRETFRKLPPETFRKWRGQLIDAGLLRVTVPSGKRRGYIYELLGMENLPTKQCIDECFEELHEEDRKQYGSCEKCGGPRELLWGENDRRFIGCPKHCNPGVAA